MTKIRLFEYAITLNLIILAMEYADVAQTNFAVMRTFFIITVLKVFKIVKIYFHSAKLLIKIIYSVLKFYYLNHLILRGSLFAPLLILKKN